MKVRFKKTHPDAQAPTYATAGAACFDIRSVDHEEKLVNVTEKFRTGLEFEVPDDHVMLIFSRSGAGFSNDTRLANCVGVIDSDYRGEVQVKLTRDDACNPALLVKPGDRIAQGMILPAHQVTFEEVGELTSTDRGDGGFGSTGAA